ncbi:MAG: acyltransferase [Gammaproteobacteria bacterium]|nr:acyltransferase [Gammaproteobacteria bacterium]MCB1788554.1 acyltransferase [Gammaproteobacteria bacterium]
MITIGIHSSAVVENHGELVMPDTTVVEPNAVIFIGERGRLELGQRNILYPNVTLRIDIGWMRTGEDVSFGPGVQIYEPRAGLEIGDHCMIGGGCMLCGVNHGRTPDAGPMRFQAFDALPIRIGANVWLGMGVIVLPGVTIGDNAVIGAGSLVTRDIPDGVVAFGSPCRVMDSL